jgi:hypothetical protein
MSDIELEINPVEDVAETPNSHKIVQILQTPPEDRKMSMMLMLYKATSNIQFFINLQEETPEAHIALCQFLGYENLKAEEVRTI